MDKKERYAMSQQQSTTNGVLLGAIVGGVIGAVSALLFAPKAGSELREDLAQACQTIGQKTKDIASTVGQSTKNLSSVLKEEYNDLASHAKDANQNLRDALSTAADEVKEEANADGR
jgi:gas vesicle protein